MFSTPRGVRVRRKYSRFAASNAARKSFRGISLKFANAPHIIPFPAGQHASPHPALARLAESSATIQAIARQPFSTAGLVFGLATRSGNEDKIAVANAGQRIWRADEAPWGRTGGSARGLAAAVVNALRPDWDASFWTVEFFDGVCSEFEARFLSTAPSEGGSASIAAIRAWMQHMHIGVPVWELGRASRLSQVTATVESTRSP